MADLSTPITPATVTTGQSGHAALHTQERDYIESLRQEAQAAPATYVPLSDANELLVGDGLELDQDPETGAVTLSSTSTGGGGSPAVLSRARIFKGDTQALTAGSNVTITLGSTEAIIGGDLEYVPNGIRVLKAGAYLVGASVWSYTGSAGERSVAIRVNATTVREFGGSAAGRFGFSDSIILAVNDVVTLQMYSAAANGVQGFSTKDTGLTLTYLGATA